MYHKQDNIEKAAKHPNKAKELIPDEAQKRLTAMTPRTIRHEASDSSAPSSQPQGKPFLEETSNTMGFTQQPILMGPYFPVSSQPNGSVYTSQLPSTPMASSYAIDKAPHTLFLVNSFNNATTDDNKRVTREWIEKVIEQFDHNSLSIDSLQELSLLTTIPDKDIFLRVIDNILKVMKNSIVRRDLATQGLAVVLSIFPDEIDLRERHEIFNTILDRLKNQLETASTNNNSETLISHLRATSELLDAMLCRGIQGLDRENIYNPLNCLLDGLASYDNLEVSFLVQSSKQSLAYIGNDESLAMSIYRRGRLSIGIALDTKAIFLEWDILKLEEIYEKFTNTCDFSSKSAWYQGLLYVDFLIGNQDWGLLERLIVESKLKSNDSFLQGVCFRLERLASTHTDDRVRDGAKGLLRDISSNWTGSVQDTALYVLQRSDTKSQANTDVWPPVWDQFWCSTPKSILLKSVQDIEQRNTYISKIPDLQNAITTIQPISCTMDEVNKVLNDYYKRHLTILRVSGDKLDLKSCYVNLAIVEAKDHRNKDKDNPNENPKETTIHFQRMPSYEEISATNMLKQIPLDKLFDECELRGGTRGIPKRILIYGRAGIGKSTLCKKMVYSFQNGLWSNRFDAILWLPLRELKRFKSRDKDALISEKYFAHQDINKRSAPIRELLNQARVLYILDGLDEFVPGDDVALDAMLTSLLGQTHVVVTSRPYGIDRSRLQDMDLELETIGFSTENINEYITSVLKPKEAREVKDFVRQAPVIRGLVNIPVQLDLICYSWKDLQSNAETITMTNLYQTIVQKLRCKDLVKLQKKEDGETWTLESVSQLQPYHIDDLMVEEVNFLGYLAFQGLKNDHQIEFNERMLSKTFQELDKHRQIAGQKFLPRLILDELKRSSFLHTTDPEDLDENFYTAKSEKVWYFLHLTFQEYFAATWIAQHLQVELSHSPSVSATARTLRTMVAFVQEHKYNPRYEIVWRMVVGLLKGDALVGFFDLLQEAPRDLIGGRHQHILASCLKESRSRLDTTIIEKLDSELMKWLHFELKTCGKYGRSMLGSNSSFPESLVVKSMDQLCELKPIIIRTLGARSALSEPVLQFLIGAVKDGNWDVQRSAAEALDNQFTLPESVIHSLIGALKDSDGYVKTSAASSLGRQLTLPESTIRSLLGVLKDDNEDTKRLAAEVLDKQSTLPESAIQSLIDALKDSDEYVWRSAVSSLDRQSTLPESIIQSLVGVLKDGNEDIRRSAAEVLGKQSTLPESAIQSLVGALKDDEKFVRKSASEALGNQPILPESAIQSLIGVALKDNDGDVRRSADETLAKQSTLSESAIQSLIGALKDDNIFVRRSAAEALTKQSTLPESANQYFVDAVKDGNWNVRRSTAEAFAKQSTLPESVIQSFIDALKDDNWNVRRLATEALGNQSTLPESAIQSLVGALKDDHWNVKRSAAEALSKQFALPESAIQSLIGALKDDSWVIKRSAAEALGNQSILSELAIESLVDALKDDDKYVRKSAVSALIKQSTLPESTVQSFVGVAFKDDSWSVRRSATEELGKQSTLPESIIQSLIGVTLKDDNWIVKRSAADALAKQSTLPESAIQSLIGALKDNDGDVRISAAEALSKQSTLPESVIQSLIDALMDDDGDVRRLAAETLSKQSTLPEPAIQSLIDALKDDSWDVRRSAAEALDKQPTFPESAIKSLIGALKDDNWHIRRSAADALGNQPALPKSAIKSLISALKDYDGYVRRSAVEALGNQSILPESAIQSLTDALKDDNEYVRRSANVALSGQCYSLFITLPRLTQDEIVYIYKNHLFGYSCKQVISLQVQNNRLYFYTERGPGHIDVDAVKMEMIISAFKAVRHDIGV